MDSEFTVVGVLSRSLAILTRHFRPFGILALLIYSPSLLVQLGFSPDSAGGFESQATEIWHALFESLLAQLLVAALVLGMVRDQKGQGMSPGEILRDGMPALLPVIVVAILCTCVIFAGSLLLIVPGFVAMAVFWVVVPVTVIERPGIVAAFRRSAELTSGNRLKVFGVLLVMIVPMIVILVFSALAKLTMGGTAAIVATWLLSALAAAFSAVLVAVSYRDLRLEQEDSDSEDIVAVFG